MISEGMVSGVNWMRLVSSPRAREKARAMVVLPTPGTSSSRTWPSASRAIHTLEITSSLPTMDFFTSARTFRVISYIRVSSFL